jgi:hypothetical protein
LAAGLVKLIFCQDYMPGVRIKGKEAPMLESENNHEDDAGQNSKPPEKPIHQEPARADLNEVMERHSWVTDERRPEAVAR